MSKTYKCNNCGASLIFKEGSTDLFCESCESTFHIDDMENQDNNDVLHAENSNPTTGETEQFKVYKCSTCGAELMTDAHTSSTFCSYCSNPTLIEDRLTGETSPAYVIPFRLNKEKAMEAFRSWTKSGFFTPSEFKSASTLEKISGIYVPFWLYDYNTSYHAHATCTRVRHDSDGNYNYTHTDWFEVTREVAGDFKKIPADASEKMNDNIMDKLEPFHYENLVPFKMPFLSGFLSEKYNFTSDEMTERVQHRVLEFLEQEMNATMSEYATANIKNRNQHIRQTNANYVVLPVWMLNYRYKNKDFLFAINGDTGKIVGDLPISKGKTALVFVFTWIITFFLVMLIGGLF